jgi:hypothetical protein
VQRLISKYGLAAHLAVLAVAPLFLFPFYGAAKMALVLFWLSIPALIWLIMEPSRREGERMRDARGRVVRGCVRDPLLWFSIVLIVVAFIRWCNNGVEMLYDAEAGKWSIATPAWSYFPGAVDDEGRLPLAAMVAFTVISQGVRHALGASARMGFLFSVSIFASVAALIAIGNIVVGGGDASPLSAFNLEQSSYIGIAFGLALLAGLVSMVAAFEHRWHRIMILYPVSIGGTASGLICFSPTYMIVLLAGVLSLILLYSLFYCAKNLSGAGEFKLLVLFAVSLCMGLGLVYMVLPALFSGRLDLLMKLDFFPDGFWELRQTLSQISKKIWLSDPWTGTGLGSFPIALDFYAADINWQAVSSLQKMPLNGWWYLMAERGIAGALILAIPFVFLMFTYFYRAVCGITLRFPHPGCLLFPFTVFAGVAFMFVDSSVLRPEALLVASSLMSVSAAFYPVRRKRVKTEIENG